MVLIKNTYSFDEIAEIFSKALKLKLTKKDVFQLIEEYQLNLSAIISVKRNSSRAGVFLTNTNGQLGRSQRFIGMLANDTEILKVASYLKEGNYTKEGLISSIWCNDEILEIGDDEGSYDYRFCIEKDEITRFISKNLQIKKNAENPLHNFVTSDNFYSDTKPTEISSVMMPDWSEWIGKEKEYCLWKLVALSVDIDPNSLNNMKKCKGDSKLSELYWQHYDGYIKNYENRLEEALKYFASGEQQKYNYVDFILWLDSFRKKYPNKLLQCLLYRTKKEQIEFNKIQASKKSTRREQILLIDAVLKELKVVKNESKLSDKVWQECHKKDSALITGTKSTFKNIWASANKSGAIRIRIEKNKLTTAHP